MDTGTTSFDTTFETLANQMRRETLCVLLDNDDGSMSVQRLVAEVTARGNSIDRDSQTGTSRVELNLRHIHLPKLVAAGLVEHDRESRTVRLTGGDGGVRALLGVIDNC